MTDEPKVFRVARDRMLSLDEWIRLIGDDVEVMHEGRNLLFAACRTGKPNRIRWLLEQSVDPHQVDKHRYTVVAMAALSRENAGQDEIIEILIGEGVDLDLASFSYNESPIRNSIRMGNYRRVARFIEAGADPELAELTPLHVAALNGDLNQIRRLASSSPMEARDSWSRTPWFTAMCANQTSAASLLAELGADIASTGNRNESVLHACAAANAVDCVQVLLQQGIDVDSIDESNCTALHFAAESDAVETARLLLKCGASMSINNHVIEHPINVAASIAMLTLLKEYGADLNRVDGCGYWPLSLAAEDGDLEITEWLIARGAKVDQTSTGEIALHKAISFDHLKVAAALIAAGSNVNALDVDYETPLFNCRSVAAAKMLVEAGADLSGENIISRKAITSPHVPAEVREYLNSL